MRLICLWCSTTRALCRCYVFALHAACFCSESLLLWQLLRNLTTPRDVIRTYRINLPFFSLSLFLPWARRRFFASTRIVLNNALTFNRIKRHFVSAQFISDVLFSLEFIKRPPVLVCLYLQQSWQICTVYNQTPLTLTQFAVAEFDINFNTVCCGRVWWHAISNILMI